MITFLDSYKINSIIIILKKTNFLNVYSLIIVISNNYFKNILLVIGNIAPAKTGKDNGNKTAIINTAHKNMGLRSVYQLLQTNHISSFKIYFSLVNN